MISPPIVDIEIIRVLCMNIHSQEMQPMTLKFGDHSRNRGPPPVQHGRWDNSYRRNNDAYRVPNYIGNCQNNDDQHHCDHDYHDHSRFNRHYNRKTGNGNFARDNDIHNNFQFSYEDELAPLHKPHHFESRDQWYSRYR
jgi:hypothetical protein